MRVMVIVKASKDSEAGKLPSTEMLTAMGKFNEELVKAGVMLAGEGLQASSKGKRVRFSGSIAHRHRWSISGNEGTDRRLLDVAGEIDGRSGRMAEALSESARGRLRSRNSARF